MPVPKRMSPPSVPILPTVTLSLRKSIIEPSLVCLLRFATTAEARDAASRPSFRASIPEVAIPAEVLPTSKFPDESKRARSVLAVWINKFAVSL